MQQITYQEAVELMMFGGREDITVSIPQPMSELKPLEIRNLGNAGAVFFIPDEAEKVVEIEPKGKETKKQDSKVNKPLDVGKVMALYNAGWNIRSIAEEMGRSYGTIWNCIDKHRAEGVLAEGKEESGVACT